MRRRLFLLATLSGALAATGACSGDDARPANEGPGGGPLPSVDPALGMSLSAALGRRRSTREYGEGRLSREEVAHLFWAAQGVSSDDGLRTAPSAGALYPLSVLAALPDGLYRYDPARHRTDRTSASDLRSSLARAALDQEWVSGAAAVFAITGDVSRTASRYGGRAERYVLLEAGHAAQNLLLQAVALGLRGAPVGAFDDDSLHEILLLSRNERPVYLLPVGRPHGE